jgi:hypothetical protein
MSVRLAILLLLCATPLAAQTPAGQPASEGQVIDWLKANDFSVRKTFDGKSKDESEPARFSYSKASGLEGYWLVDLGIKIKEWELCDCTGKSLLLYPVVEWHKTTNTLDPLNKFKIGAALDTHWGDLRTQSVAPVALFKASYERDALNDLNSQIYSVLVGIQGVNKAGGGNTWLPMSHINDVNGNLVFRYAPFAGLEHFDNLKIDRKGLPTIDPTRLTAFSFHLQVDLYPLNRPTNPGWLELVGTFAHRRKIGGDDTVEDSLSFVTASLNVYFDHGRHFAIGGDYEDGRSPKSNFTRQHSTGVALKIKF